MLKNFKLGSEIADKGNFDIANLSMAISDFGLIEGIDYLKFGAVTLFNENSTRLPAYIRNVMTNKELTNLEGLIPFNMFKEIIESNFAKLKGKYEEVRINNKPFVRFKDKQLEELFLNEKITKTVVPKDEVPELYKDNYIDGDITLSGSKSLVWY